ncbi:MAG: SAM-dependent chlorinase/fluorinase [Betaproteobacteria bacterium]|nr:SAM-dependent chlorinase/fluorinase [Betaproteobacteria bacterium]
MAHKKLLGEGKEKEESTLSLADNRGLSPCPFADLAEIIYLDPYGNAATGLRARALAPDAFLRARDRCFQPVRIFADAPPGTAIWYENSNGLAELAINQGSAAASCALAIGTPVSIEPE